MARIVAVHGIAQQHKGAETLAAQWLPALRDGMRLAGAAPSELPDTDDFQLAFYGDLFRMPGSKSLTEPAWTASDVDAGFESDLLESWWRKASMVDDAVTGPVTDTKWRAPNWTQRAIHQLSKSPFLAGLTERALVGSLKQVRRYFADADLRMAIQARVAAATGPDTVLVIGHSLGSVVAYETLCAHPQWTVENLLTLGSPLGMPNLIFDRLEPRPNGSFGAWPGGIRRWVNIADKGDIVAIVESLALCFGQRIEDMSVHNGSHAHDVAAYLTSAEAGTAIRDAFRAVAS